MTSRMKPGSAGRSALLAQLAGPWWLFLVTGVAWLIISMVILRFLGSGTAVGVLLGVVFLVPAFSEILIAAARDGWR